jgi:hypothetical protein
MTTTTSKVLLNAYAQMVCVKIEAGFQPYLFSFMFNELAGNSISRLLRMEQEVQHVYSHALTHIIRRPRTTSLSEMPLLIASPDWPVPKTGKDSLSNIAVNDGLHYHGIWLQPPKARMKQPLNDYFGEREAVYCGQGRPLSSIWVEPVNSKPEKTTRYVLKSLPRGRASSDQLLILPRTHSEMWPITN